MVVAVVLVMVAVHTVNSRSAHLLPLASYRAHHGSQADLVHVQGGDGLVQVQPAAVKRSLAFEDLHPCDLLVVKGRSCPVRHAPSTIQERGK